MSDTLIGVWRNIITGQDKSWVLFQHGTCIILTNPEDDFPNKAIQTMMEWGPVVVGTTAGDFATITLSEYPGWVVTGHHPDILNYVSPEEVDDAATTDAVIGLIGRYKRNQDGEKPQIIHIEYKDRAE